MINHLRKYININISKYRYFAQKYQKTYYAKKNSYCDI